VIGSSAVTEPELVAEWLGEFGGERLVLGFDVRIDAGAGAGAGGVAYVTTHGWTRTSKLTLAEAVGRYANAGLRHVLCTDVDRDGALTGPNFDLYRHCAADWPAIAFQASGGIRNAADLAGLTETGVAAAIAGKALLEGRLSDEEISRFSRSE
jgi:phosphoribosylformimino-5-aminoimidazole carboxamide ribotide isomerase